MKKLFLLFSVMPMISSHAFAQDMDGRDLARNFYRLVLEEDSQTMVSAFTGKPHLDTPRTGAVVGIDNLESFIAEERAWLLERGIVEGSLTEIKATESEERIVYEQSITLENTPGPSKQHNFAVVVDLDKGKASSVRIYYGLNAIMGGHNFSRPAMLEHDPALFDDVAPPVKQYLASIGNAYRDVYRMFTDDGCFGPFCGMNRAKFFVIAMHTGPVPIKLTTATCDEVSCATEENLASWGEKFSINTAGLAVFEFTDVGQISRARVYDDIHDVSFLEKGWFAANWDALSEGFKDIGCPLKMRPAPEDSFQMAFGKIMMEPCPASLY
jgi:hypothetical protein